MHGWDEISLSGVEAVDKRIWWTKMLDLPFENIRWLQTQKRDCQRYEQMLADIERDWEHYDQPQKMHDAAELCYLLLGGHDATLTGERRQARITALTKGYYGMENGHGL